MQQRNRRLADHSAQLWREAEWSKGLHHPVCRSEETPGYSGWIGFIRSFSEEGDNFLFTQK